MLKLRRYQPQKIQSSHLKVLSAFIFQYFVLGRISQWQMTVKQLNFEPACDLKTPPSIHT